MGNKMKKSKLLKFIGMILVLAVVVFSSIMAYKEVIIPKKYNKYIELGNEHIAEEHYRQAIYDFESALRIDKNSIEALLGLSKSYVGISDDEKVKECVIDRAETIYKKLDRGKVNNELLDYKVTLDAYIKTGKEVNDGYFYTQDEVNQMTEALKKLISRFSEV